MDQNGPSEQSYMFTKNIRGTDGCWEEILNKLLAMIQTLGPPHFFMTLRRNDQRQELRSAIEADTPGRTVTILIHTALGGIA